MTSSTTHAARLVLCRHGATEWSAMGRHTGRTDVALTDDGKAQSHRLGVALAALTAGSEPLVFCSSLQRAVDTATLAAAAMATPAELSVSDALVEVDYGVYEGLTYEQIDARQPGWDLVADGCPGGESIAQVTARCDSFIAKLERVAVGRTVVVFTHGHLSRVLTCRLLDIHVAATNSLHNDTASFGCIDDKRGTYVLSAWNVGPTHRRP